MSLPQFRKVPRTPAEWAALHWSHYLDHKLILKAINAKAAMGSTVLLMPPAIWPVPGNVLTGMYNYFHQLLHNQMNDLSGDNSYDFLQSSLDTLGNQQDFVESNYSNHFAAHVFLNVASVA